MTSRERVQAAIEHRQPDRVPIDLGATGQTGISASTLFRLRCALGMAATAIELSEPFQLLGKVDEEVLAFTGADVIGLNQPTDMFGVAETGKKKPFAMADGTPTLISAASEFDRAADGSVTMYPQGRRDAPPSAHMPAGGFFFDNIDRAPAFDEDNLTPLADFKQSFSVMTDEAARQVERESHRLFDETGYAIIGNLGGGSLGDSAVVPGPGELHPQGIRRFDDWLMAHMLYPEYIQAVYEMQTEVMLKNLAIYREAVGNRIQMVWISGTDFGTQNSEFFGADVFRDLYKPYYQRMNDWVHQNTQWKTFFHCCGSVVNLLDDFVEMGVDILNPVQVSAKGMDPAMLKEKYGGKLTFWGGGVDTQQTLPFGTPAEVAVQVKERLAIFSKNGGYVFNPIHNIVGNTPVENLIAMYQAVHEFNGN